MEASLRFSRSVLGTAMTVPASGTGLKKHYQAFLNGVTFMLTSRLGTVVAGASARAALLCIITAGASAATLPELSSPAASVQVSEDYARAQITRDGYTKLTDLQKTDHGWTAKALEDGKQVSLIVSSIGGVQKQ